MACRAGAAQGAPPPRPTDHAAEGLASDALPATGTYEIDPPHTFVVWSAKHKIVGAVRGRFDKIAGTLVVAQDPAACTVDVVIEAASISTNEAKRDAHLRSADFFDVEQFPLLTFASKHVEVDGSDLRITGDLTIHGVTREVVLEAESLGTTTDPWGNARVAFAAKTSIDRKQFGLHWNQVLEAGGFMVGDKVEIGLDVQAVKVAAAAAA